MPEHPAQHLGHDQADGLGTDRRGGPEPEDIILDPFGRDIPEA